MTLPQAWMQQAESDFRTAQRVDNEEYPAPGTLARRNHEYPFQDTPAHWRAPSEENAFTAGEMKRIRNCAGLLIRRLRQIFDALELLYP